MVHLFNGYASHAPSRVTAKPRGRQPAALPPGRLINSRCMLTTNPRGCAQTMLPPSRLLPAPSHCCPPLAPVTSPWVARPACVALRAPCTPAARTRGPHPRSPRARSPHDRSARMRVCARVMCHPWCMLTMHPLTESHSNRSQLPLPASAWVSMRCALEHARARAHLKLLPSSSAAPLKLIWSSSSPGAHRNPSGTNLELTGARGHLVHVWISSAAHLELIWRSLGARLELIWSSGASGAQLELTWSPSGARHRAGPELIWSSAGAYMELV